MLDHVFTDAISALRDAFGNAFLERQAFEEHFNSDILLGDLVWETTYGLPGEGLPRESLHTSLLIGQAAARQLTELGISTKL